MLTLIALAGFVHACACAKAHAEVTAGMTGKNRPCAATVEDAVKVIVGIRPSHTSGEGYRAQNLVVDAVLHRAWVRVARCNDPAGPMMLVALEVPLSGAPVQDSANAHVQAEPRVHRGDRVRVTYADSSSRLDLQGIADADAAEGEQVSITLPRVEGQTGPERHLRGTVDAQGVVEMGQ